MRERPILFSGAMVRAILEGRKTQTRRVVSTKDVTAAGIRGVMGGTGPAFGPCPYGVPGDRLWVRETWRPLDQPPGVFYKADHALRDYSAPVPGVEAPWKPSIFMPRWACRLTLEITDVRVERLQDISEGDCWAEGIERSAESPTQASTIYSDYASPRRAFNLLWDSLNAKRGYGWDANKWVRVLTFAPLASPAASPSPLAQTSRPDNG